MRGPKDPGKEKPPDAPAQHPTEVAQAPDHSANEEESLPAVDDKEQESGKFSQDSIVEETQQSSQASNADVEESEKEGQEASAGGITQSVGRGTESEATPPAQRETSHGPPEEKCQDRREAEAHVSAEAAPGAPEVEPFEMFGAVVAEMQSAPMEQPRAAWIATIGELYSTVHAKVKVDEDLIPSSKKRYPKLKSEEKILLFKLFKAICVESNGTFEEWERYAQAATQDLYNTNWSFKNIMHSMISKVEWATTQPLNQWAEKVTAGAQTQSARANRTEATSSYQDFMFNPSKFSKEAIATLRAICAQPAAVEGSARLRPGTKDEWSIIGGMTEGTIVCRRMPEFLRSVLDSRESMRLYSTIQSQVEGELMLQLRGRMGIKPNRQMTQWIQEDIRVAAEELQVNTPELKRMLKLAKTISYNEAQRSIHFFFFDRATARQYQTTMVPFRRTVYRLTNVHRPNSGSVWSRQGGRDGKRRSNQRHYAVDIYNVTRFTDIGRLTSYLQQHIGARFEMEDMDSCTPESRTSTVWRLTAHTSECPDFLRGIVRIVWYGRTLVLQHPSMRQRLQCLRCGNLGHTMARCRYTDQQLAGSGGRVAKEQDVAKLEDLARPFSSFEEIKQSAAKRLELQAEAERQEQAALTPTEARQETVSPTVAPPPAMSPPAAAQESAVEDQKIAPEPKRPWVTVPMRNGRKLYAHPAALKQKFQVDQSRFAVLAEPQGTAEQASATPEEHPPSRKVIEIQSDDDTEEKAPPPITPAELEQLHIVSSKPPKLQSIPQLVGLKQRERQALKKAIGTPGADRGPVKLPEATPKGDLKDFQSIEESLRLRQVITPQTGNCMAMAIAQALADDDLVSNPDRLEEITNCLKQGIRWTGQLHLTEQFGHYVRTTTLVNVQRGWVGMEAHESLKQFKWYLEEYAATSSKLDENIPRYNWGSSEMMAMAANFLQREIYVLAYDTDHKSMWYCSKYQPSTTTRNRQTFEIGQHIPLQLGRCIELIRAATKDAQQPPLVVRYWGEHYSAFIHLRDTSTEAAAVSKSHGKPSGETKNPAVSGQSEQQLEGQHGASQDAWSASQWDGNVDDLRRRLTGMTIPHELQCEIYLILEQAEPTRYAELLAFLVNTASQLTHAEREELLQVDLTSQPTDRVRAIQQKYQVSTAILQQWRDEIEREKQEEKKMYTKQTPELEEDSDSSYLPSSADTSQNSQVDLTRTQATRKSQSKVGKRPHTMTPNEGEQIRLLMRAKLGHHAVMEENAVMEDVSPAETQLHTAHQEMAWPDLWNKLSGIWPAKTATAFPLATSSEEEWCLTARQEPNILVTMCQRFQYPEEVLTLVGAKVMELWTAGWRKECLYESLVTLRSKVEDKPTRRWIDEWKAKLLRPAPHNLAPLIDNREDWQRLKNYGYGEEVLRLSDAEQQNTAKVLRLCEVGHKDQLAQHLLCALIYDKEIKAITDQEDDYDTGPQTRLVRHLSALDTIAEYKQAYMAKRRSVDWRVLARFFSNALERGAEEQTHQY